MNDRSRMMLYALTAVACVMWIWQSVKESMNDGTIISTSNIIFLEIGRASCRERV